LSSREKGDFGYFGPVMVNPAATVFFHARAALFAQRSRSAELPWASVRGAAEGGLAASVPFGGLARSGEVKPLSVLTWPVRSTNRALYREAAFTGGRFY
jgi:hypothetical protein